MASISGHPPRCAAVPLRLGPGDYVDPDGHAAAWTARQHFLDAAIDVQPDTLTSLVTRRALALAAQLFPPLIKHQVGDDWDAEYLRRVERIKGTDLDPLTYVNAWMDRWRLWQTWCGFAAMNTLWDGLYAVARGGPPLTRLRLPDDLVDDALTLGRTALIHGDQRYMPPFDVWPALFDETGDSVLSWEPRREPRAVARRRLANQMLTALDEEMDRIEAQARAAGDVPTPVKTTGRSHFVWLARYQVKGETYAEIARSVRKHPQTVKDAVRETAETIVLDLRDPDPPGRPRRSRPTDGPRCVRVERRIARVDVSAL